MSESLPRMAQRGPFLLTVEAGRSYWWCACGRSASQPFCDGSHKGSGFSPIEFTPYAAGSIAFCGCKQSGRKPRCDGSHNRV